MTKTIKMSELKIGMYINLPSAWHAHPFISNSFIITSNKQIQKMVNYGIRAVKIDEKKGIPVEEALKQAIEQPDKDFSQGLKVASEKLKDVLADKEMPPDSRALAVHSNSVDMIKNLWGTPTGEQIVEFKRGIFGVVDMVLADDSASEHLLKLTSYDYNTYTH